MQTKSVKAENQFTNPKECFGYTDISISGTFSATVTLQRSFDGGSTWYDVETWTSDEETYMEPKSKDTLYRIGVKTGDYNSGTVLVRLK